MSREPVRVRVVTSEIAWVSLMCAECGAYFISPERSVTQFVDVPAGELALAILSHVTACH